MSRDQADQVSRDQADQVSRDQADQVSRDQADQVSRDQAILSDYGRFSLYRVYRGIGLTCLTGASMGFVQIWGIVSAFYRLILGKKGTSSRKIGRREGAEPRF